MSMLGRGHKRDAYTLSQPVAHLIFAVRLDILLPARGGRPVTATKLSCLTTAGLTGRTRGFEVLLLPN